MKDQTLRAGTALDPDADQTLPRGRLILHAHVAVVAVIRLHPDDYPVSYMGLEDTLTIVRTFAHAGHVKGFYCLPLMRLSALPGNVMPEGENELAI